MVHVITPHIAALSGGQIPLVFPSRRTYTLYNTGDDLQFFACYVFLCGARLLEGNLNEVWQVWPKSLSNRGCVGLASTRRVLSANEATGPNYGVRCQCKRGLESRTHSTFI